MKKRGKLKLKVTAAFSLLIAALIVFTAVLTAVRYKNGVYITQFGNSGHSQMMGYAVKTHGGKTILIDGGTDDESSEKLIDTYGAELASYAVQMAHHGQNGGTEELYRLVSPKICFWPTPDWLWENDSGSGKNTGPWKTLETRKWIEELGVRKNVIEKDGNQTVHIW